MTDVTQNQNQDRAETELSAADEQVLRELTERARTGGLKLTGEGGLLGRRPSWSSRAPWKASWTITSDMASTTRKAATAAILVMAGGRRRCSPTPGRWRFRCPGTGIRVSSPKSSPKGSGG